VVFYRSTHSCFSTNEQEPLEYAEAEKLEMTLDEWKASQATSRVKKEFNVRLAGEGEDPKQWKKTVALEPRKRLESSEYAEELDDDSYKVNTCIKHIALFDKFIQVVICM